MSVLCPCRMLCDRDTMHKDDVASKLIGRCNVKNCMNSEYILLISCFGIVPQI
jgi:hypothetical protein